MFIRKPLLLIESDEDEAGGGTDAEGQESEETTTESDEGSESESREDDDEAGDDDGADDTFDAARALAKIKKANSEAKTQRERAKAAEDRAKGLEPAKREAAEQRVARRLGLPDTKEVDEFLSRLKGETVDELAEDAEKLLSLMAPKDEKKSTTTRPKERLRGGGKPDDEPDVDAAKLADSILSNGF